MHRTPLTLLAGADAADLAGLRAKLSRTAFLVDDPSLVDSVDIGPECICCRPRGGFTVALLELLKRRSRGETGAFDRVLFASAAGDARRALAEVAASPIASAACRIASLTILGNADALAVELADHLIERDALTATFWLDSAPLPVPGEQLTLGEPAAIRSTGDLAIEHYLLGWQPSHDLDAIGQWLQGLIDCFGERLLRLTGEIDTPSGCFSVQAVGHALANPAPIERIEGPGSRLRFVTQGLEPNDLKPNWPVGATRSSRASTESPRRAP